MNVATQRLTVSRLIGRTATRMNGAGNEILILDLRSDDLALSAREVRAIARGERLGFDQMMVLFRPRNAVTEAFVRIYNNDGAEAGACGNGTRCVAWYLMRDSSRQSIFVETDAGVLECTRLGPAWFRVDMGEPRFGWRDIPLREPVCDTRSVDVGAGAIDARLTEAPALASMGNPHAIFWVENPAAFDLESIGPALEWLPIFPQRANISLARIEARDRLSLRVWERGVGITRACGSAACAALVSAVRLGRAERVAQVRLPGGELTIEWRASDNHVLMTGPVAFEAEIQLAASLFDDDAA